MLGYMYEKINNYKGVCIINFHLSKHRPHEFYGYRYLRAYFIFLYLVHV